MVKGISRQVIVVDAPVTELFEQAIFILKDQVVDGGGVSEDMLLKEAKKLMGTSVHKKRKLWLYGPLWACIGALLMGAVWLLSVWL